MELKNRERKLDVEKLTLEQADALSVQISEKVKEINDKAINEANRFLNVYGMEAKMVIVIDKIGAFAPKKPKKTRKKKEANL